MLCRCGRRRQTSRHPPVERAVSRIRRCNPTIELSHCRYHHAARRSAEIFINGGCAAEYCHHASPRALAIVASVEIPIDRSALAISFSVASSPLARNSTAAPNHSSGAIEICPPCCWLGIVGSGDENLLGAICPLQRNVSFTQPIGGSALAFSTTAHDARDATLSATEPKRESGSKSLSLAAFSSPRELRHWPASTTLRDFATSFPVPGSFLQEGCSTVDVKAFAHTVDGVHCHVWIARADRGLALAQQDVCRRRIVRRFIGGLDELSGERRGLTVFRGVFRFKKFVNHRK